MIHHGGNNSFTECLYFGKPAIIMPYVWDGHDNATRVEETGHGFKLDRYNWTDDELAQKIMAMLTDKKMKAKLKKTSKAHARRSMGRPKAAKIIDRLAAEASPDDRRKLDSFGTSSARSCDLCGPAQGLGPSAQSDCRKLEE